MDVPVIEDGPLWIEIEEQGYRLEVVADASIRNYDIEVPPRLGWHVVEMSGKGMLRVRRNDPGTGAALFTVQLLCQGENTAGRADWFELAESVSKRLRTAAGESGYVRLLADIDALRASAIDERAIALAAHLRAQALLMNGHSADAAIAFAAVERAWTSLGDMQRASAARVARAAEAYYSGDYASVIALTQAPAESMSVAAYYPVRLQYERCLALSRLARVDDAAECYDSVISAFDRLDERADYVNALQSYAGAEAARDDIDKAEVLVRKALTQVEGPHATLLTGRIELTLADLALRRGSIADSYTHSSAALAAFGELGDERWEGNTLLKLAELNGQLGAYDEAYAFLAEAVERLDPRDAPARVAASVATLARLEGSTGNRESARWWWGAAERSYAGLDMPVEADNARAARAALDLDAGDVAAASRALLAPRYARAGESRQWAILEADLAIRQGRLNEAATKLEDIGAHELSMRERLRLEGIEARYWAMQSDTAKAGKVLMTAAQRIDDIVARTRNPVLRHLVARQSLPLMRQAFDLGLSYGESGSDILSGTDAEWAWSWIGLIGRDRDTQNDIRSDGQAYAFDRAVAAELLVSVSAKMKESSAHRALLSVLAQSVEVSKANLQYAAPVSLTELQGRLDDDTSLLAYLEGSERGAILFISSHMASIVPSIGPVDLRERIGALQTMLDTPAESFERIDTTSRSLGAELLKNLRGSAIPRRLVIVGGGPLDGLPWQLLRWPGSAVPLLDTTNIASIRLDERRRMPERGDQAKSMQVFIASQLRSDSVALPVLPNASVESLLVEKAVVDRPVFVNEGVAATRDSVLSALAASGSWVHIAAHGTARPARIGYTGLWLDPARSDLPPEFLGWLDILQRGVQADLVVLNACQLADSGEAINGNLGFASAVSRAGAQQVVAAMWPVSDAAAALWVPAFYSALIADPEHDAAAALRIAQLKLRDSRAFRHPFYWAGLQVFARFPLADPRPSPPPAAVVVKRD